MAVAASMANPKAVELVREVAEDAVVAESPAAAAVPGRSDDDGAAEEGDPFEAEAVAVVVVVLVWEVELPLAFAG